MSDQRVTLYALGELSSPEREAFEKDLAASPQLQHELQETIALAEALQSLPPDAAFTPGERAALRDQCLAQLKISRRRLTIRRFVTVSAVAATLMLAAGLLIFSSSEEEHTALLASEAPALAATQPLAAATPITMTLQVSAGQTAADALAKEKRLQQHLTNQIDEVSRLKKEGDDFYTAGRFDLAFKRYTQVLEKDPYNIDARRGMERVNQARDKYASSSYNESRALLVKQVDAAWSLPARSLTDNGYAISANGLDASATPETVKHFTSSWAMTANAVPAQEGYIAYGSPITTTAAPAPMSAPMASRSFRKAGDADSESYAPVSENTFLAVTEHPLSTFSIDVDTASYANIRRFLQRDQLPRAAAIRTEELINYFTYDYPRPQGDSPFSVSLEVSHAPWDTRRELVRIGLRGRELPTDERPPANLVFLIDVSGSMNGPAKLPLLQKSLRGLVENLSPEDHVAIVVYAGSSGLVLPSTKGTERHRILEALANLRAGGSTNGGDGIRLAYETARQHFIEGGNNRVILCTDGDFNVGTTSQDDLVRLIEKERASGVFLSVLGFGTGNLKDSTMEKLADKGNGNYAYIDSLSEGRKVLVDQMGATLFTIAKDVKIQVEFNPARVAGYRLIGYENRLMAKEDFNDDQKDAGEIGAGHTVTALYEIIPAGTPLPDHPSVDPLKYQKPEPSATPALTDSGDLLTVKLRYKAPDGDKSRLLEIPLAVDEIPAFEQASPDFQFSAAVAAFGMKLRNSPSAGKISWADLQKITRRTLGDDPGSYRAEFLTLVEKAARLSQPDKE